MSDSSEEEEFTGAETPLKKRRSSAVPVSYAEDDDDDDESSDDDMPLSALVRKATPKKKTAASPKKKKAKPATKKSTTTKKKSSASRTTTSTPSSSSQSKSYEYPSAALYGTESTKGLLIQRLLCRWWYVLDDWPTGIPNEPPQYYDALDGFPGVFVCTSTLAEEPVGHLLDTRDKSKAPTFSNFAHKTAAELQTLLVQALEGQTKELISVEGSGTATEKELKDLLKWAKKVNPTKADKEAVKILKAQKLELPALPK